MMLNEIIAVLIGAIAIILGIVAWRFYISRRKKEVQITWEEPVIPPHIHAWVDELTTIRNVLVSIGYEKPYEELVDHIRFADVRTDKIWDNKVDEAIEALIKVAVTKDRKGIEKALDDMNAILEQRREMMATKKGEV